MTRALAIDEAKHGVRVNSYVAIFFKFNQIISKAKKMVLTIKFFWDDYVMVRIGEIMCQAAG